MKKQKLLYSGLILATTALVSGGALADNCSGNWTNTTQSADTIDLGDGHTLTTWFSRGSVSSQNSPFNTVGACGGYVLTTPDGKSRTVYACTRKNQNGDSISDAGSMEPGNDYGTWTQMGGTGVFAGKKWSGTWRVLNSDGQTTLGTFTGNCN
jgi:hypothetical protein